MSALKAQVIISQPDRHASVRCLKGVGPEKEKLLARLGVKTLNELLHYYPRAHERRFPVISPKQLTFQGKECVVGQITAGQILRYKNGIAAFKAVLTNGACELEAVFHRQPYLSQVFKPGKYAVLYGKAERFGKKIQMLHPEYVIVNKPLSKTAHYGGWTPIYPLTEDLSQKRLRQLIFEALGAYGTGLPETLPEDLLKKHGFVGRSEAVNQYHFPENEARLQLARRRLVFDEFFEFQLKIEAVRKQLKSKRPSLRYSAEKAPLKIFYQTLPFKPTMDQERAVNEIVRDLSSESTMNRLLQGDVGSGKTLVASAAAYIAVKNSFQVMVMAPTAILSQQLFAHFKRFLEPHGIRVGYLAQGVREAERRRVVESLGAGDLDVLIGTHALLENDVSCRKLGLVIVDEQHKFGVHQRSRLRAKSGPCHFLSMTATPIPRSLAMTLYGDVDLSTISEGVRKSDQVQSGLFGNEEREAVYAWMRKVLASGGKAFIVCPALKERGADVRSAEAMHAEAVLKFSEYPVMFLHGQMRADEKKKAMDRFRAASAAVLVATVIVEVGVDVPEANLMVIENAECFGLAQLHQLRGRVGRSQGRGESYCVLFSDTSDEEAREKLDFFIQTKSGFKIAEKDLAQRGAGEQFGYRQHGVQEFKIGDLSRDLDLMRLAQDEARSREGSIRMLSLRYSAGEVSG